MLNIQSAYLYGCVRNIATKRHTEITTRHQLNHVYYIIVDRAFYQTLQESETDTGDESEENEDSDEEMDGND